MKRFAGLAVILSIIITAGFPACTGRSSVSADEQSHSGASVELRPYTETIPGTDIQIEMVPITGSGVFPMGSPENEAGRAEDEGPQHPVALRPFWMAKTEITWEQYDEYAFSQDLYKKKRQGVSLAEQPESEKAADAVSRPTPPYTDETFGFGRGGQPAISMTHHAAMEYCRWLSAKTGKAYRLPTEAEWEYACRAGTKTAYQFSDNAKELGDYAWYAKNSEGQPQKVAGKKPNPWGLYDMHGNLAEWVLDLYEKDFYEKFDLSTAVLEPVLIPTKEKYPHVVRGGSWDDEAALLRSAARRASEAMWSLRDPQLPQSIWWHTEAIFAGFRIVRPLEQQENLRGHQSQVKKYD